MTISDLLISKRSIDSKEMRVIEPNHGILNLYLFKSLDFTCVAKYKYRFSGIPEYC